MVCLFIYLFICMPVFDMLSLFIYSHGTNGHVFRNTETKLIKEINGGTEN